MAERPLIMQWVVRSIPHGGPFEIFFCSTDWYNIGCGVCYPLCGMVHIKEPLLLIVVAGADSLSCLLSGPLPYI